MSEEFDHGEVNPTIESLQNFWNRQCTEFSAAHGDIPAMEIVEAMLTVAVSHMYALSNAETVAARLAAVAGGLHAMGKQAKAEQDATTRH
jgi:hypothetical protein